MSKSAELAVIIELHKEWLDSGNKSGKRADLSGAMLDNTDLSGVDLSGALLRGTSLKNANLSTSKLIHTNLNDANLCGANLSSSQLFLADFTGADLMAADLSNACFPPEQSQGSIKRGPRFKDANLQNAVLTDCFCFASDFTGANLDGVDFHRAHLEKANFSGNDLSALNLSGSNLTRANLANCNIQSANAQDARLLEANIQHANLAGTDIKGADLRSANLAHSKADGIQYNRQTKFRGIRLEGCYGSRRFRRSAEDQDFIEEFKQAHPTYYWIWMVLTDCGRSLVRVVAWSLALSIAFGLIYYTLGESSFHIGNENGLKWNLFTTLYYSVVTFTTLGFGDITPSTPIAAAIVMVEVVIGYVMLGILISILATKVARRS